MLRAALATGVVGLCMLAVPATGQVTTTSTTVATTTTTATPATTTTTTAPVAPVTPRIVEPPTAMLSGTSGEVAGELGSWCWPQGNGQTLCRALARIGPPDPAASLPVTRGETVTLRFETAIPVTGLRVGVWTGTDSPAIPAPVGNPSRFPINLALGRHVIVVHAIFQGGSQNGVEYEFEVVVQQARRPLSLTG